MIVTYLSKHPHRKQDGIGKHVYLQFLSILIFYVNYKTFTRKSFHSLRYSSCKSPYVNGVDIYFVGKAHFLYLEKWALTELWRPYLTFFMEKIVK